MINYYNYHYCYHHHLYHHQHEPIVVTTCESPLRGHLTLVESYISVGLKECLKCFVKSGRKATSDDTDWIEDWRTFNARAAAMGTCGCQVSNIA